MGIDIYKEPPANILQRRWNYMMSAHEEVAEYCRKVAEQGRYLVVMEYDAIVAHVQKIEGKKPASKGGA